MLVKCFRMSGKLTFVFFIRHRSQAFQTRLCRPSITPGACSWEVVLDLLETRCTVLEPLEDFLCEDLWSSIGGVGKLDMPCCAVYWVRRVPVYIGNSQQTYI